MNIEMRSRISEILRLNALVLFNLDGQDNNLVYQRHIASKIDEIPGSGLNAKIENSIILAINLWQSWKIHATKSEYFLPWYSCVQVDDEWLLSGGGTPPYVIFDSENPHKVSAFFDNIVPKCEIPSLLLNPVSTFINDFVIYKKEFYGENIFRIAAKSI